MRRPGIGAACLLLAACGVGGPPAELPDPIVSVSTRGEPPEYAELEQVPSRLLGPLTSETEERIGLEWSSVTGFEGQILLVDDQPGPLTPAFGSMPVLAPENPAAQGLVLFRLRTDLEPVAVERMWREPFREVLSRRDGRFDSIESTVVRDGRLYLLGSHAHYRSGKFNSRRQAMLRIEAGDPPRIELKRVWLRAYLAPAVAWVPELAPSMTRKPVDRKARETQINIEGLAVLPDTPDLLLGLRAPVSDAPSSDRPECAGAGIVLRLRDVDAIFDRGLHPQISVHAFLCMDHRGVASIEFDPLSNSYLLAATRSAGRYTHTGLWRWDPRPCAGGRLEELMRFPVHRLEGVTRLGPDTAFPGKLALTFDSHWYAGQGRERDGSEGDLLIMDLPLDDWCANEGG